MRLASLRLRLLGLAALMVSLALLIAGLAIGLIFAANVERSIRTDLQASLNTLIARIDPTGTAPVLPDPLPDPRYAVPLGGAYWQVADLQSGANWRSRSLLDAVIEMQGSPAPEGRQQFLTVPGPGQQSLAAVTRNVRFGDRSLGVTVAVNRAVIDESIRRFGWDLFVALAVLGLVLIIASALQVQLGLLPLKAVRVGLTRVRDGHASHLPSTYPTEVQPLVSEVNALLEAQTSSLEFARARAADLAHSLRTPLTVLRTIVPRLAEQGASDDAALLDRMVDEMDDRIDYQLRLSRLRHRTRSHELRVPLNSVLSRTLEVLRRSPAGEMLDWQVDVPESALIDMDRQDLQELLGILIENAAKWAKSTVTVSARRTGSNILIDVADDGPGLPKGYEALIGRRGVRLDENTEGSGLGLAIAREIIAINAATIDFDRAPQGGLLVRLTLRSAQA